jgi:hypothetical protein
MTEVMNKNSQSLENFSYTLFIFSSMQFQQQQQQKSH